MSSSQKSVKSDTHHEKPQVDVAAYQPTASAGDPSKLESGVGGEAKEAQVLQSLGYQPEKNLVRNRGLFTLLFQALAIAAIPYGFGAPIISAILGGGQLPLWLGWVVCLTLQEFIGLSLAELSSAFPTSAGCHYATYRLAPLRFRRFAAYLTGWVVLVGNITITLSVTFGFAALLSACISIARPDFAATSWQLLLIFYGILIVTLFICLLGNRFLPFVDSFAAGFTLLVVFLVLIVLPSRAEERHSASYTLGHFDSTLSGWGGFGFAIALLPSAYCFSAIGMITSMSEEVSNPQESVPWALSLAIPVGLVTGLFFIIPICATLPPLEDIVTAAASSGQALPYIFATVTGSSGGGVGLIVLVLILTLFCSISITTAASRTAWSFARDHGIPFGDFFSVIDPRFGVPRNALVLVTLIQMLLGLINLGSTSAFNAFVATGVIALAVSYAIPIGMSLIADGRKTVAAAAWHLPPVLGWVANIVALLWVAFQSILFSMPTVLPTSQTAMNYASVVLVGLMTLSLLWYALGGRKRFVVPTA